MGLAVNPGVPGDGTTELDEDFLQALVDILEIFGFTVGSGGTGQGSIQDINVADDAAISSSKIADGAVVKTNTVNPGMQTITRPTKFTGGLIADNLSPTDDDETISVSGGAPGTTLNCTDRSRFKVINFSGTANFAIQTIVVPGAQEGDIITLIVNNTSAANDVSLTITTADSLDSIKCLGGGGAAATIGSVTAAEDRGTLGTFIYARYGNANLQWWQI